MNDKQRLQLKQMIKDNDVEDQTDKIRQIKQLGLQFLDFLIQAFWKISSKNLQLQQK